MAPARKFDHDEARRRYEQGESLASIARSSGVTPTAVKRVVDEKTRKRMQATANKFTRERYRQPCLMPGCDRIVWVAGTRPSGYCRKHYRTITAEHGTESMYQRHGCRCGKCVAAASAAKRARRERAKMPCSHDCGTLVESINRRNPDKPLECRPCALKRIHAEQRRRRLEKSLLST